MNAQFEAGCYVSGDHSNVDEFNLDIINFAENCNMPRQDLPEEDEEDYGQILSDLADEAVDYLNSLGDENPPYTYWIIEESCLFLCPDVEGALEDVEFRSSRDSEYPPDEYTGLWMHINDHGNATLYLADGAGGNEEIWAAV